MRVVYQCLVMVHIFFWSMVGEVFAQSSTGADPEQVVNTYSTKLTTIIKGPVAKLISLVVLLAAVGALLRGRHRIAISAGIGFIILLFLQII